MTLLFCGLRNPDSPERLEVAFYRAFAAIFEKFMNLLKTTCFRKFSVYLLLCFFFYVGLVCKRLKTNMLWSVF